MPSTVAMAAGTDAGSPTDASSTIHTPSGNSPATSAPTSSASRVLPTPPTPVSVTSRFDRTSSATSATICSRPTSELSCCGRLPGEGVDAAEHRELGRETVGDDLVHRHPPAQPAEPVLAQRPQRRPGRAAAPRSRRRRAPDRRARATSAVRRGSPRCRSSSGRVRSPRRCADPCGPRSRRRCRRAAAPATRSPRPRRRRRSRTRRRSRRRRCANT